MVGVGGVFGEEAVAEDVREYFLNVVREDGGLVVEEGGGLGRALEGQGGAGGDGVILAEDAADGLTKCEEVALKSIGDGDAA